MPLSKKFSPDNLPDLLGKVFLVTGGYAGIGYWTVLHLASKRATVYIGGRSEQKANDAIGSIRTSFKDADLRFLKMDLKDLTSVNEAATEMISKEKHLHCLVNNAGIATTPFELTSDGYEAQIQVNYLSHWLLTRRLLPLLRSTARESAPGTVRVVNVSSKGHEMFAPASGIDFADLNEKKKDTTAWTRYGQSKLANILHAKCLHRKYGPGGSETASNTGEVWSVSVHPGSVKSNLLSASTGSAALLNAFVPFLSLIGAYISPREGSFTSLFAAASDEFRREDSGGYIIPPGVVGKPSKQAENSDLAEELWAWTEGRLQDKLSDK